MKNIIEIEKRKDVAEGFCYRYTEEWLVEYEYEDEEIYYTKWISLISSTYNEEEYEKMKIKYETNPLKELGILFENNTILNLHTGEVVDWGNHELKDMIESLGYSPDEFLANPSYKELWWNHIDVDDDEIIPWWNLEEDVVTDILYNDYHDNVIRAIQLINELEEKFGTDCIYLYYAIKFRNNFLDDCEWREGGEE